MKKSHLVPEESSATPDTPRTSNLKFLRAKRLSYFCGKSSCGTLPGKEDSSVAHLPTKSQTPRRCLSAPALNQRHSKSLSSEFLQIKDSGNSNEQSHLPPAAVRVLKCGPLETGEKTDASTIYQPLAPEKVQTHSYNSKATPQKSSPVSPVPKSLLQNVEPQCLDITNILQPTVKETREPTLENKDISTQHGQNRVNFKMPSTYHSLPANTNTKASLIPICLESEPEVENSTHRSFLSSSLASSLDQGLLRDDFVPESEKLQHVMTWANKFLNKCSNEDEVLNTTNENAYKGFTTRSNHQNGASSVRSLLHDDNFVYSHKMQDFTKGDHNKCKISSDSPGNTPDYRSNLTHYCKTDALSSKPQTYRERLIPPPSTRQIIFNELAKNALRGEASADLPKHSVKLKDNYWSDDDDVLFGAHNVEISGISESDDEEKHTYIVKGDSSSSESGLDTEKLNTLLENLKEIQIATEKQTNVLAEDGSGTARTYLVRRNVGTDDSTGREQSVSFRTFKEEYLFEDPAPREFKYCKVCNFANTTKTSWCEECGSVLGDNRDHMLKLDTMAASSVRTKKVEKCLDDFVGTRNEVFKGLSEMPTIRQINSEYNPPICWEDKSDVVSDTDGSVLEKYFHYVKQLDMLRSKEREKQNKHFQGDHSLEMSSEEESSEEHLEPLKDRQMANYYLTKTDPADCVTSDSEENEIQFLESTMKSRHLHQEALTKRHFGGAGMNNSGIDPIHKHPPLDKKQQTPPQKPSKDPGPRRYWEKSSIAWSSYTHGEMKPRSQHGIRRPSSADPKRKHGQGGEGLETSSKMTKLVGTQSSTPLTTTPDYKNVAAAYMKTANAWAVTEHLCKTNGDGTSLQQVSNKECGSVWLLLPDELWIIIFAELSYGDLARVAQVCRRFRHIANDDSLWKVIKVSNSHCLDDNCLADIGNHHPESLSLYRCHDDNQSITEEGLTKLFQRCRTSLMELNITNCSGLRFEGDTILLYASRYCTRLTSVDISWTAATDKGIISLVEGSMRIQNLSMNGCKITDHSIMTLLKKHSKSLIKLEIFGCHAITEKCLISVAMKCAHLENLNIGRVPKVTDACLTKIGANLIKMRTLNVTGLNVVRDRTVHHIVKQCPKLEALTLSSCSQVTDVSLVEISNYLKTIKYLDVSGCKKISDIGIQALARSCQQICYLDLSSTGTGKRGVCLLASYCYASLECIKLSFCKDVTPDAVEKLCKNCIRLKTLHLYGCRISQDLEHIKSFSKSIQIFHDLSIPAAKALGE